MSKHSAADIKQAARRIDELIEKAREAYADAQRISDEFGVPYEIPHNEYHPEKYAALRSEYANLDEEDQIAWVKKYGFDPEDFSSEYGDEGWQSSYC